MSDRSPEPGPSRHRSRSRSVSSSSSTRSRGRVYYRSMRYRSPSCSRSRSPTTYRSRSRSCSSTRSHRSRSNSYSHSRPYRRRSASPGRRLRPRYQRYPSPSVHDDRSVSHSRSPTRSPSRSPLRSPRSPARSPSRSPPTSPRSSTRSPSRSPARSDRAASRSVSPARSARSSSRARSDRAERSHSVSPVRDKVESDKIKTVRISEKEMERFNRLSRKEFAQKYRPTKEGMSQRIQFTLMRNSKSLTDVELECDGRIFHCHKLILASSSRYFERMFQSEMQEVQHNKVSLTAVMSADILNTVLDYIYTTNINFTWKKMGEVLRVADYLQMDTLKEMGSCYLLDHLKPHTALEIHRMAKVCNLERVQKKAWHVITNHFCDVICSHDFVRLRKDELVEILGTNKLDVEYEDPVVQGALSWTHHRLSLRQEVFHSELLPLLRLDYCTRYMLSHLISNEPLFGSQQCQAQLAVVLAEATTCQTYQPIRSALGPRDNFQQNHGCLVVYGKLGGVDDDFDHCAMYYLDEHSDNKDREAEWKHLDTRCHCYPHGRLYHIEEDEVWHVDYSVCALPHGLFVSGGLDYDYGDGIPSYSAYMFSFDQMKWHHAGSMLDGRYKHSSVYLNDEVLVIGGMSTDHMLATVGVFDLMSSTWGSTSSITHRVLYPAVATLGLNIYVLGGINYDEERGTNFTQVFNTSLERWQLCARMPVRPRYASAVGLSEHVYVVGGLQVPVCLRYSPKFDEWTELVPPMFHHGHGALSVWQGKLMLAGGMYEAEEKRSVHKQIELYDPGTNSWDKAPASPLISRLPRSLKNVCLGYAVTKNIGKYVFHDHDDDYIDDRVHSDDDTDDDM